MLPLWDQTTHDALFPNTSEAPTTADTVQIWTIVVLCIVFCVAVRHLNDFFAGDTITLVEEGTWGGRFRHREDYRFLRHIEKDFAQMYHEITVADRRRTLRLVRAAELGEQRAALPHDPDSLQTDRVDVDVDTD